MELALELLGTADFRDELILKLLKDHEAGNLSREEALDQITAHERLYKLAALAEKEKEA